MNDKDIYRNRNIKSLLRLTRRRAKIKNYEININEKYITKLWNDNSGRCEITNIEFCDEKVNKESRRPFAASIDRISSKHGYIIGNVRLVCQCVNMAMFVWGEEVFHKIAFEYVKLLKNNSFYIIDKGIFKNHNTIMCEKGEKKAKSRICSISAT
jgi:hypothetical protein